LKERSTVRAPALADAVTHLPWLSPCAASLVALARQPPAAAWAQIRFDPGAVLLLLARSAATLNPSSASFGAATVQDPAVLDAAIFHFDREDPGFVDWNEAAAHRVYQAGLAFARLAAHLADMSGRCDPNSAWTAGLLAPLGWYAVCAVDSTQVTACLSDAEWAKHPLEVQQRYLGFDQSAIARRLVRRWRLPRWAASVAGHLGLPVATARLLGADPDIFSVVQLAVGLAQQHGGGLGLSLGATLDMCATSLGLSSAAVEEVEQSLATFMESAPADRVWSSPLRQPLLRDLLGMAADHRRLSAAPVLENLESDLDYLHHTLHEQQASERSRLQALKLNAMAEFAAGAGHEINNPLAVISGQAQYLLHHETEPARQRALQAIVNQAQRIHQLLRGLMEYARPQPPQKQPVDFRDLLPAVTTSLADLAAQRRVELRCPLPEQPTLCLADPRQLSLALSCLLQNAIEAAPPDGWAGMRLETASADRLVVVVEDSGPGLTRGQREHLFDPFYSGRQAGRGRGLGLPTAWRLAQEHGGDLRYADLPDGPTRFVLSLPWDTQITGQGRDQQAAKAS
jgi:signal transduction histidine kinase